MRRIVHKDISVLSHFQPSHQFRALTTRGQLNPVHSFKFVAPATIQQPTSSSTLDAPTSSISCGGGVQHDLLARDPKAFKTMITNPGPLRVTYDPNYLDWYYRAYKAKVNFEEGKQAAAAAASSSPSGSKQHGGASVAAGNKNRKGGGGGSNHSGTSSANSPNFVVGVENGKLPLPATSMRRRIGEYLKKKGTDLIEEGSTSHGMLDLFERQHYFPNIHIDRASDYHVVEILKEYFVDETLDEHSLWEKALLYRAMLQARKQMYPESFNYIQNAAEKVEFSASEGNGGSDAEDNNNGMTPDDVGKLSQHHEAYFKHLVDKYHVENAVEAHVVLACHRRHDVHEKLHNANNAEDDASLEARFKSAPSLATYPKLSKLLQNPEQNPEYVNLARCLIFGEFNTFVSMDPFVKFPAARDVVTRGFSSVMDTLQGAQGAGATKVIVQRRGRLLQPLTRSSEENIDSRGKDVARLQQRFGAQDSLYTKELLSLTEENPELFQSDMQHFNPRTVRAEIRDAISRKVLRGVDVYRKGRAHMGRSTLTEIETEEEKVHWSNSSEVPLPTVAHFLRILTQDPHVSFASAMATTPERGTEIKRTVSSAASAMYRMGLVYHKQYDRQVEKQKVTISLETLDRLVSEELKSIYDLNLTLVEGGGSGKAPALGDVAKKVLRLGQPLPWASRSLEQFGWPSEARMDDYQRWMKKPTGLKPQPTSGSQQKKMR